MAIFGEKNLAQITQPENISIALEFSDIIYGIALENGDNVVKRAFKKIIDLIKRVAANIKKKMKQLLSILPTSKDKRTIETLKKENELLQGDIDHYVSKFMELADEKKKIRAPLQKEIADLKEEIRKLNKEHEDKNYELSELREEITDMREEEKRAREDQDEKQKQYEQKIEKVQSLNAKLMKEKQLEKEVKIAQIEADKKKKIAVAKIKKALEENNDGKYELYVVNSKNDKHLDQLSDFIMNFDISDIKDDQKFKEKVIELIKFHQNPNYSIITGEKKKYSPSEFEAYANDILPSINTINKHSLTVMEDLERKVRSIEKDNLQDRNVAVVSLTQLLNLYMTLINQEFESAIKTVTLFNSYNQKDITDLTIETNGKNGFVLKKNKN